MKDVRAINTKTGLEVPQAVIRVQAGVYVNDDGRLMFDIVSDYLPQASMDDLCGAPLYVDEGGNDCSVDDLELVADEQ
jgi:hypothetical protein